MASPSRSPARKLDEHPGRRAPDGVAVDVEEAGGCRRSRVVPALGLVVPAVDQFVDGQDDYLGDLVRVRRHVLPVWNAHHERADGVTRNRPDVVQSADDVDGLGSSPTSSSASRSAVRSRSSSSGSRPPPGKLIWPGWSDRWSARLVNSTWYSPGPRSITGTTTAASRSSPVTASRVVVRDPVELHAGSVGGHGLNSLGDGFATEAWGEPVPARDGCVRERFPGDGFALSFDELVRK